MSQKMPVGGFRWVYGITEADIRNYSMDDDLGYFLSIDCHIPVDVQDETDDVPLFPDSLEITEDMASFFTNYLREKVYGPGKYKCKQRKLAPNHFAKRSYKCHILAAQMYLSLG